MTDMEATEEKRLPCPELTGKALYAHASRLFQMYSGEETTVKLRFHRELLNAAIDRFGHDIMYIPDGDDHFNFTVNVAVSPMFLSWIIGFGNKAKVVHPESVVAQCKELCRQAMEQY
jgi:predicted DNA-binding transcriptional regulator YafY